MGGGKGGSTSTVTIPPEVLARYNAVNAQAQQVASTPFQPYMGQFVSNLSPTQQAGILNTNTAASVAQPYYEAAAAGTQSALSATDPYQAGSTSFTLAGGQNVGALSQDQIGYYQQPITQNAIGAAQPYLQGANSFTLAGGQNVGPLTQNEIQYYQNPLNQSAIGSANQYQNAANQLIQGGSQGVGPLTSQQIQNYQQPITQAVINPTLQALQQQQAMQNSALQSQMIQQGAFGGSRGGLQQAELQRQQLLGTAQALAPIYQQNYQSALQTALGQQGVQAQDYARQLQAGQQLAGLGQQAYQQQLGTYQTALQAAANQQGVSTADLQRQLQTGQQLAGLGQEAYQQQLGAYQTALQAAAGQQGVAASDLARQLQTGQQLAGLGQQTYQQQLSAANQLAGIGTGAQAAALQGAQAQIAAGGVEQQTAQADLTARYNQYLQQQGYPFQVAQFLANIAEGTGALSGSTTTTTPGGGFFSDRRLKEDVKEIGKTHDGQPIYSYKYANDNDGRTQIGLMAQDVEKKHPEAVGVMGGYKTVDYKAATRDAERPARAMGGVIPNSMGGAVFYPGAFAGGGLVSDNDWDKIRQAQLAGLGPFGAKSPNGTPGISSYVPSASLPVSHLMTSKAPTPNQANLGTAVQTGSNIATGLKNIKNLYADLTGKDAIKPTTPSTGRDSNTPDKTGTTGGNAGGNTTDKPIVKSELDSSSQNPGGVIPSSDQPLTQVSSLDDKDKILNFDFAARGGVIPRKHYRVGGGNVNPYDPDSDMDYFPEQALEGSEQDAEAAEDEFKKRQGHGGSGGGGGLGEAVGVASGLANVGKFLFSFLADGGVVPNRRHYQQAGVVPDDDNYDPQADLPSPNAQDVSYDESHPADKVFDDRIIPQESGGKQFDKNGNPLTSKAGAIGIAQVMPTTAPEAAKLAGMEFDEDKFRNDPEYNKKLGQAYFRAQWDRYGGDKDKAMAAYNAGPGNVDRALQKEQETGLSWKSFLPGETKNYIGGVSQSEPQYKIGRGSSLGDVFEQATPDFVPTSSNFWIPALSGIGSMLASRNPTLAGAIGEGIIGGVSGYETNRKAQLEMGKAIIDNFKNNFTAVGRSDAPGYVLRSKLGGEYTPEQAQAMLANTFVKNGIDPALFGISAPTAPTAPTLQNKQPTVAGAGNAPATGNAPVGGNAPNQAQPNVQRAPVQTTTDLPAKNINDMNENEIRQMVFAGKFGDINSPDFNLQNSLQALKEYRQKAENNRQLGIKDSENNDLIYAEKMQKEINDRVNSVVSQQVAKNTEMNKNFVGNQIKSADHLRSGSYNNFETSMKQLADSASTTDTGTFAPILGKAVTGAVELGFGNAIPDWAKTYAGNTGAQLKSKAQLQMKDAAESGLTKAANASLRVSGEMVPDPSMNPFAYYKLVGESLGDARTTKKYDQDLVKVTGRNDIGKFNDEWANDPNNKTDKFRREVFNELPVNPEVMKHYGSDLRGLQFSYRDPSNFETFMPSNDPLRAKTDKLYAVKDENEYNKLPANAYYMDNFGRVRRKQ